MINLEKTTGKTVKVFAPKQIVERTTEFYVQGTKYEWNDGWSQGIDLRKKGALDLAELISVQMNLPAGSLIAIEDGSGSRIIFEDLPGEAHFTFTQVNRNYVKVTVEYISFIWAGEDVDKYSPKISPNPNRLKKSK